MKSPGTALFLSVFVLGGFIFSCAPKPSPKIAELEKQLMTLQLQNSKQAKQMQELSESLLVLQSSLEKTDQVSEVQAAPVVPLVPEVPRPSEFLGVGSSSPPIAKKALTNADLSAVKKTIPLKDKEVPKEKIASNSKVNSNVAEEYQEAFVLFQSEKYDESESKFSAFLKKYPSDELSDNAQYWLGEIYYKKQFFSRAALFFENVAKLYPQGNKVPEALFKAGESYHKLSQLSEAKRVYARLVTDFPSSVSAQEAKEQLSKWSKEQK